MAPASVVKKLLGTTAETVPRRVIMQGIRRKKGESGWKADVRNEKQGWGPAVRTICTPKAFRLHLHLSGSISLSFSGSASAPIPTPPLPSLRLGLATLRMAAKLSRFPPRGRVARALWRRQSPTYLCLPLTSSLIGSSSNWRKCSWSYLQQFLQPPPHHLPASSQAGETQPPLISAERAEPESRQNQEGAVCGAHRARTHARRGWRGGRLAPGLASRAAPQARALSRLGCGGGSCGAEALRVRGPKRFCGFHPPPSPQFRCRVLRGERR